MFASVPTVLEPKDDEEDREVIPPSAALEANFGQSASQMEGSPSLDPVVLEDNTSKDAAVDEENAPTSKSCREQDRKEEQTGEEGDAAGVMLKRLWAMRKMIAQCPDSWSVTR